MRSTRPGLFESGARDTTPCRYSAGMSHNTNLKWEAPFLEALRHVPLLAHACAVAGIERTTPWHRRKVDKEFAAAYDDAMEHGVDLAEQEAFKRAVTGFDEPLTYQGRVVYHIEHYDVSTGEVLDDGEQIKAEDQLRRIRWRYKLDAAGQRMPVTVKKHSDSLLITILKGRRKSVYADRVETTGAGGGPVQTMDTTTRAARVLQLMAIAQLRKDNEDLA